MMIYESAIKQIETKLDIGVHKLFQIKQEQYYFENWSEYKIKGSWD